MNARQPIDFGVAAKIEDKCVSELQPEWQLGASKSESRISLKCWVEAVKKKIEDCGMDSVFRVINDEGKSERYILDKWYC